MKNGEVVDREPVEKMNVLLVGDDAESAELIEHTLEGIGLTGDFRVSRDCRCALDHLRRLDARSFWLILLDEIPDEAALAFLQTVKTDPMLQMIPVVVLATADNAPAITACYDLGAAGYLIKTGTGPDLAEKIRRACEYWTLSRVPATQISSPPS